MKPSLKVGLKHRFSYRVPRDKTVPFTYPESRELAAMPEVFATGFMIILMEWTCVQLLAPQLDAGEGSLGVGVNVTHLAGLHRYGRCRIDRGRRPQARIQGQRA